MNGPAVLIRVRPFNISSPGSVLESWGIRRLLLIQGRHNERHKCHISNLDEAIRRGGRALLLVRNEYGKWDFLSLWTYGSDTEVCLELSYYLRRRVFTFHVEDLTTRLTFDLEPSELREFFVRRPGALLRQAATLWHS